jgi:hypothetical protein
MGLRSLFRQPTDRHHVPADQQGIAGGEGDDAAARNAPKRDAGE